MLKKLIIAAGLVSAAAAVQLEKVWESDAVLKVPESVILDSSKNVLYAANINGKPTNKDSNGFISILKLNGEIETMKFAVGFDAPKGMAIYENKLFVSDIDTLRVVDLNSGKIVKNHKIAEAKFLNDVAVSNDGTVYVSDFSGANKAVYKIAKGKVEKWLDETKLLGQRPNGLWLEEKSLVIGTKEGSIFKADLGTKKIRTYNSNIGVNGIDGILPFDDNSYISSDWAGRVFISNGNKSEKIIDRSGEKVNAADIWYDIKTKRLYIPTFFDNRILCYEVK